MEDNIIINENEKIGIETECGDNIAFEIKYSYKKQLQGACLILFGALWVLIDLGLGFVGIWGLGILFGVLGLLRAFADDIKWRIRQFKEWIYWRYIE